VRSQKKKGGRTKATQGNKDTYSLWNNMLRWSDPATEEICRQWWSQTLRQV